MTGEVQGIVTAPLDKAALLAGGYSHPGHTEMLAEVTAPVLLLNGQRYDAFVYGARLNEVTREKATLFGIALADSANPAKKVLAVHSNSVRLVDYREAQRANALLQNCPISSLPATTHHTPVFGEVNGKIEAFCGAGHLAAVRGGCELDADGIRVATPHLPRDSRLAGGDRGLREIVRPDRPVLADRHVVRLPRSGVVRARVGHLRPGTVVPVQVLGGARHGRFGGGRL
jgi:hypothetical protein